MENKVGDGIPSLKEREKLLGELKDVVSKLRKFGIVLSDEELQRVLHERKGAQPHIETVVALAREHKVSIKNVSLDGLVNDRTLFAAMAPFVTELRTGLMIAEHTAAQAESESWEAFLAYYGVLSRMAEHDAELARALDPVVKFMANGPRLPKPPPA